MNRAMRAAATGLLPPLDPMDATPLYRQVGDRFRHAIASGRLKPGDRVPAARALAAELGLARGTIESAYASLVAEGYFETRGQAGTVVAPGLKLATATPAPPPRVVDAFPTDFRPDSILPLQMGLPALDAFPRKIWARLGARCVRAMQPAQMVHPPVPGLPALRDAIATYLQVSRGIDCRPAQVIITSGYRQSLALIAHAVLTAGDRVWTEDPGYPPTRELLRDMGITTVPVRVDGEGMVVDEGVAKAPGARAAVITPGHQSPLCVSLALSRRLALLAWATRHEAWIVEDDYDGEYRYASRPLPSLKSLDRDDRVIYAGTFSKVLLPGLRLAYLVVPESQVPRFGHVASVYSGASPWLTQAIVSAFVAEGHFARHIQRMRRLYAERRATTIAAFADVLGERVSIDTPPGGMHVILRLPSAPGSDRALVARLRAAGLYAEAMSDWTHDGDGAAAILVGFTNVASAAEARALAHRVRDLL